MKLVVTLLGARDLAVERVEAGDCAEKDAADEESGTGSEFCVDPLSEVEKEDDADSELDSEPREPAGGELIRATLTMRGAARRWIRHFE